MNRTPFVPFTVRTVSGERLPVPHRDFAWLTPSGRRMFVAIGEDSVEMLDVLMIESIQQPADTL